MTREQAIHEAARLKVEHNLTSFEIGQAAADISVHQKANEQTQERPDEASY